MVNFYVKFVITGTVGTRPEPIVQTLVGIGCIGCGVGEKLHHLQRDRIKWYSRLRQELLYRGWRKLTDC